jgi:NAD(P)H-dependent flavin oxidoreductase YrpB (nitropropane dioxygenase family)
LRSDHVLDRLAVPVVLAPLAGGPSTPELSAAVSNAGDAPTAMTRAFTGRLARGIRNRFMDQHSAAAPGAGEAPPA